MSGGYQGATEMMSPKSPSIAARPRVTSLRPARGAWSRANSPPAPAQTPRVEAKEEVRDIPQPAAPFPPPLPKRAARPSLNSVPATNSAPQAPAQTTPQQPVALQVEDPIMITDADLLDDEEPRTSFTCSTTPPPVEKRSESMFSSLTRRTKVLAALGMLAASVASVGVVFAALPTLTKGVNRLSGESAQAAAATLKKPNSTPNKPGAQKSRTAKRQAAKPGKPRNTTAKSTPKQQAKHGQKPAAHAKGAHKPAMPAKHAQKPANLKSGQKAGPQKPAPKLASPAKPAAKAGSKGKPAQKLATPEKPASKSNPQVAAR